MTKDVDTHTLVLKNVSTHTDFENLGKVTMSLVKVVQNVSQQQLEASKVLAGMSGRMEEFSFAPMDTSALGPAPTTAPTPASQPVRDAAAPQPPPPVAVASVASAHHGSARADRVQTPHSAPAASPHMSRDRRGYSPRGHDAPDYAHYRDVGEHFAPAGPTPSPSARPVPVAEGRTPFLFMGGESHGHKRRRSLLATQC